MRGRQRERRPCAYLLDGGPTAEIPTRQRDLPNDDWFQGGGGTPDRGEDGGGILLQDSSSPGGRFRPFSPQAVESGGGCRWWNEGPWEIIADTSHTYFMGREVKEVGTIKIKKSTSIQKKKETFEEESSGSSHTVSAGIGIGAAAGAKKKGGSGNKEAEIKGSVHVGYGYSHHSSKSSGERESKTTAETIEVSKFAVYTVFKVTTKHELNTYEAYRYLRYCVIGEGKPHYKFGHNSTRIPYTVVTYDLMFKSDESATRKIKGLYRTGTMESSDIFGLSEDEYAAVAQHAEALA